MYDKLNIGQEDEAFKKDWHSLTGKEIDNLFSKRIDIMHDWAMTAKDFIN